MAGCMVVSVLGPWWTFSVWSLVVAILGVVIIGLGTLISILLKIKLCRIRYYTYIQYSGWMGVPLRPAMLIVSVLGAFDGVEISIMNCVAASFGMYCV